MKKHLNLKKVYLFTLISFVATFLFIYLFAKTAPGYYTGFDRFTSKNILSILADVLFIILLSANFIGIIASAIYSMKVLSKNASNKTNNQTRTLIMIILLFTSFILSRFVFFGMHGMKDWPNLLAIISLVIIIIASILKKRIIPVATIGGYLGGFIIAMIFNTYGLDIGGGRMNNAWLLWGAVFTISILIGLIVEYILKRKN